MTIQQLQYVLSLEEERNFQRAADKCFVSQPNLTMQLKKLETEIDIQLFDRSKKPLVPTAAGEHFIQKARLILREIDELKQLVSDKKEDISGTFKVGIIPTLAPYLLPLFLPDFVRNYPDTRLEIQELKSSQIIDMLEKGTLDAGILSTPLSSKALREVPLFYEPFLAYLSPDSPLIEKNMISQEEIAHETLLLLSEGHCFRNQALNICGTTSLNQQSVHIESGSIEALKGLVNQGMGATLVPKLSVGESEQAQVVRFEKPQPVREISLVVHSSFPRERLIEVIRDGIQDSIPKKLIQAKKRKRIPWK